MDVDIGVPRYVALSANLRGVSFSLDSHMNAIKNAFLVEVPEEYW